MMAKVSKRLRREALAGYLFISPWLLGFSIFSAGAIGASAVISFTEWRLFTPAEFIGLTNYRSLFREPLFWQSLKVTCIYMVTVPLHLVVGLVIALMLNAKIRLMSFFRTLYFLPSVISGVAVALLWVWVFDSTFGIFNVILMEIGIQGPKWLGDKRWVLPALIIMGLWGLGGPMLIYLAGLQAIPTVFYEAATIDGATRWQKFRYITIPGISPVLFFNLIMGIINTFQVFTTVYIMTGGGPNNASLFYVLYIYKTAFKWLRMGYASALAWILFGIILTLVFMMFRFSKYWVYYGGAK